MHYVALEFSLENVLLQPTGAPRNPDVLHTKVMEDNKEIDTVNKPLLLQVHSYSIFKLNAYV